MATVYISGPISAPDEATKAANIARFIAAEAELVSRGHRVVNPVKNGEPADAPWMRHMRVDLRMMLADDVDVVACLDGWGNSAGAQEEVRLAKVVGIKVVSMVVFLSQP